MSTIIQNKFHQLFNDFSRATKFNVIFPPNGAEFKHNTDKLTYSVKSCTLPSLSNDINTIMVKGRPIPVKGKVKFNQEFSVTFYLAENHSNMQFFIDWILRMEQQHYYYDPLVHSQNVAALHEGNRKPQYMTFYNQPIYIEQRDFDGSRILAVYEIFNAFPINIETPQKSYEEIATIDTFTVTFAYSHFKLWNQALWDVDLHHQLERTTASGTEDQDSFNYSAMKHTIYGSFTNTPGEFGKHTQFDDLMDDHQAAPGSLADDQKPGAENYWRTHEYNRFNNMLNRWREDAKRGNKSAGVKDEVEFEPSSMKTDLEKDNPILQKPGPRDKYEIPPKATSDLSDYLNDFLI